MMRRTLSVSAIVVRTLLVQTDGKVTLRFRDTMEQERVNISDLNAIIEDKVSIASLLKKLQ